MNIRGNLISVPSIWIGAGDATGGHERRSDMVEKQIEPKIMATTRVSGSIILAPIISAITIGTIDIIMPESAEASISPKRIVHTATGVETSLSRVRACVSHGKVTGAIAEQVKKTDTDISPGMRDSTGIPRPKAKAINMNPGQSTPMSSTGPFE
jgi:hypothetical protein